MAQPIATKAIIEKDGDHKYIIGLVCQKDTEEGKFHILYSAPKAYHSDIADLFQTKHLKNYEKFKVLGGGIITIDREANQLKTYGTSGGFGSPPMDVLQRVVDENFPNFTKQVTITDYIRG